MTEPATAATLTVERERVEDTLHHIVACHTNGELSLCGLDVTDVAWCADGCTDPPCVVCDDLDASDPEHARCGCEWPCPDCDEDIQ